MEAEDKKFMKAVKQLVKAKAQDIDAYRDSKQEIDYFCLSKENRFKPTERCLELSHQYGMYKLIYKSKSQVDLREEIINDFSKQNSRYLTQGLLSKLYDLIEAKMTEARLTREFLEVEQNFQEKRREEESEFRSRKNSHYSIEDRV